MQTFVPFPDRSRSARVLDDRRLGKQRVETLQILRALHLDGYGWAAHPAVTMWRGCTPALVAYGLAVVDEWVGRGHRDTTAPLIAEFVHPSDPRADTDPPPPPWWGDDAVHRSHRAALLRKDPGHYGPLVGDVPEDLPYVWPDPPAPPDPPGRRSAWAVRGRATPAGVTCDVRPGDLPWVPLDARTGRVTKRQRQIARLVDGIAVGDVLVVPQGERLLVGHVAGGYQRARGGHRRPVAWVGELARAELRFPAALQDPQVVFPLHDEPSLDRLR